jgi:hypothetical protein
VPCVVSYPGLIAADSKCDTVIQSSDFYPTILDVLKLKPQPEQHFDGISIVPALKGQPLTRETIFTYFPHDPAVPDWLPPAIAMHGGDWKLIRIFHGGENGAHRWKLFNLHDDLSEKNDLAAKEPERVKTMDTLIEKFLADTKAIVPVPNPAFNPAVYHPEDEGRQKNKEKEKPKAKTNAKAADDSDPKLQGWKARGCTTTVKDDIVSVKGTGDSPFLGVGAGDAGPGAVKMRVRCANGGEGKFEWIPPGAPQGDAKSENFTLKAGEWQDISVDLPADAKIGILRVYLPAQKQSVEIDWIELKMAGKSKRWDF